MIAIYRLIIKLYLSDGVYKIIKVAKRVIAMTLRLNTCAQSIWRGENML